MEGLRPPRAADDATFDRNDAIPDERRIVMKRPLLK
jgi:hypothetical protein